MCGKQSVLVTQIYVSMIIGKLLCGKQRVFLTQVYMIVMIGKLFVTEAIIKIDTQSAWDDSLRWNRQLMR